MRLTKIHELNADSTYIEHPYDKRTEDEIQKRRDKTGFERSAYICSLEGSWNVTGDIITVLLEHSDQNKGLKLPFRTNHTIFTNTTHYGLNSFAKRTFDRVLKGHLNYCGVEKFSEFLESLRDINPKIKIIKKQFTKREGVCDPQATRIVTCDELDFGNKLVKAKEEFMNPNLIEKLFYLDIDSDVMIEERITNSGKRRHTAYARFSTYTGLSGIPGFTTLYDFQFKATDNTGILRKRKSLEIFHK